MQLDLGERGIARETTGRFDGGDGIDVAEHQREAQSARLSRYTDDQNRDVSYGIPTMYDPFFTMDAKVSYTFTENVKTSVVVTNLLDKEYYQFYLQPRRAVFGEIAYRF